MLTSTSRLNRSIQCQQIRLIRNRRNRIDNLSNLLRTLSQDLDGQVLAT